MRFLQVANKLEKIIKMFPRSKVTCNMIHSSVFYYFVPVAKAYN